MSARWYDVAVVGAGPAGATAAAHLARSGLDVALIERCPLPRDKPCGGGLSPKAHRLLDVDVDDLVLARPQTLRLCANSTGQAQVGPMSLSSQDESIWMVQRASFDQRLVQHAVEQGARLLTGEAVRRVVAADEKPGARIELGERAVHARVVVGADGSDGVVARSVGLRNDRERAYVLALEAEGARLRDGSPDAAVVDFSLPRGYAWLFPKGEVCNVGVGTADRHHFRSLRRYLQEFLDRHRFTCAQPLRIVGHKIPVWQGIEPLHRGSVILAGDAAGVADPFFGEGISYAIQTGRFAASATTRLLSGEWMDLSGYTASVQQVLGRDLRFWTFVSRVVYRAPALSVLLLARSRLFQRLADQAISGNKSFSRTWKR